jgi:hypothetical protein
MSMERQEEIAFLRWRRVELNAMPSGMFIEFLERKLTQHGARKVVPTDDVLAAHARRVIGRTLTNRALDVLRAAVDADTAAISLPPDLRQLVAAVLSDDPSIPWDLAVADIAAGLTLRGAP